MHELLATLVARHYLQRDEATNTFRLGVRLLHLGNAYSARFDMLKSANDVARELSDRTGETVSVALREGAEVFYLAKVEGRVLPGLPSSIGQRLPANSTGLGKALLAYVPQEQLQALFPDPQNLPVLTLHSIRTLPALEKELALVRERGVAFENEESAPNIACAAAPVRDASGSVVAAISTSVSVARWESRPVEDWVSLVKDGAAELSGLLGYTDVVRQHAMEHSTS